MRKTSPRRRADGGTGHYYRGVPQAVKPDRDMTVPADTEGSIVCTECGARVMQLTNGRPAGHAAGGMRPNIKRGMYKCEGSGRF